MRWSDFVRRQPFFALMAAGLGLAACQAPPPPSAPSSDPSAIAPPSNLDAGASASASSTMANARPGFDGRYAGRMYLIGGGGGACRSVINVTGMTVRNSYVRFGQFGPGDIGPSGNVQMVDGMTWLSGRFDGRQFVGEVSQPPPGCSYRMELNRS